MSGVWSLGNLYAGLDISFSSAKLSTKCGVVDCWLRAERVPVQYQMPWDLEQDC